MRVEAYRLLDGPPNVRVPVVDGLRAWSTRVYLGSRIALRAAQRRVQEFLLLLRLHAPPRVWSQSSDEGANLGRSDYCMI